MANAEQALDALGNPTRRQILRILAGGPRPVGAIAADLPVSRPAVSKHLRILRAAALVEHEPRGTQNVFRLRQEGFADTQTWLRDFDLPAVNGATGTEWPQNDLHAQAAAPGPWRRADPPPPSEERLRHFEDRRPEGRGSFEGSRQFARGDQFDGRGQRDGQGLPANESGVPGRLAPARHSSTASSRLGS
ncbi:MAG: metalloregulator ArsR/SmtB family transcription factor [Myxococcota bacterium]